VSDSLPAQGERYCPTCEKSFSGRERCPEDDTVLVRLVTPTDRLVGSVIDERYTVQRRIGAGGMGAVYGAVQHSVGREVAVKVVNPTLVDDPYIIKRFLREAKLTSRLSHPNAVAVLDFGQTPEGLFYLVMELISGRTLGQVLKADGPFSADRVIRVGSQILDALIGAHALSIIHRDLKPSNVIVLDSAHGRDLIKVLDFGLAKSLSHDTTMTSVTGSGALLGTPAYMPPEVARGGEADARGDLYSLGVILYQIASGRLPFVGDSMHDLLVKLSRDSAPPLEGFGVPSPLARVIERLMAREPADRYPSAALAQSALDRAEDEINSSAPRRRVEGVALAHGEDETLPATKRATAPRSRMEDSDALASTHHASGPTAAVSMAPTPAPVAEVPAPAPRAHRRLLVAVAAAVLLVVAGGTLAILLQLGGSDERPAAAPVSLPPVDAAPVAARPADAAPAISIDAAPTPRIVPPRLRREPKRRDRGSPASGRADAGYPF